MSAPGTPVVSVVIPTRGRPELLLRRALPSALAQSLEAQDGAGNGVEVIVVVDGPDPATVAALETVTDPRLRVLALPGNVGPSEARNRGVAAARAEWIALLDDDDEWAPDKLRAQLDAARRSAWPQPLVVCRYRLPTPQGVREEPARFPAPGEPIGDYLMARDGWLGHDLTLMSTVLFARRSLFTRVPFQAEVRCHEDWDWLLRAAAEPDVGVVGVDGVLATYHFHEPRPHLSRSVNWRESLRWAGDRRRSGHLSARAYAGFVVFHVTHFAALERSPAALWATGRALLGARPRPFELARFLGTWVFSQPVRRRLHDLGGRVWSRLRPA